MRPTGLVVHRALSHRLLIVAASATALFAVTVLAALGGYAASVTGQGLRATLAEATFDTAGTRVTAPVATGEIPAVQRKVDAAVAKVYGRVPVTSTLSARSDSYAAPGQERSDHPQLTTFATYSGIEGHARLTAGRWPSAAPSGTVQAALPVEAAKAMRLAPGRTVTLKSRVSGPDVTVQVTGLFQVKDPDDYFWGGDRLIIQGSERLGYTTFGPLVVPPATFTSRFTSTVTARWLLLPDVRAIHADRLKDIADGTRALPQLLAGGSGTSEYAVRSSLPDLLSEVDRALLVARSTLLIPALQLLVLAVYTLMLVARLLAEHRRIEITLMRARGAAGRQIAALAVGEGTLLAAPAAVAAPFLAPLLIRSAAETPVLRANGLRLALAPTPLMWLIAVAAALACAVAITLPPLRGIRQTYVATVAARGRGERRGVIQRAGADLALVVIAGLAIWQLSHYGGPVTGTAEGLGVDPLIVAGPALALLAGGALILRLVPIASRAGERATARSRGFAPAVGTRQVSRRPLRTAGPALLLVMTVAVGVLSVATGATWRQSQLDQAGFQSAADLRITAPGDQNAPSALGQGALYQRLPGVTALSPVLRDTGTTGSTDVAVLAVDAGKLAGPLRPHSALPAGAPMERLATGGSTLVPVPGEPERLSIGFRTDRTKGSPPVGLSVVITDALRVSYEVNLGEIPADGTEHGKTIDLAALAGTDGRIAYPMSVRGFRFTYIRPRFATPSTLTVTAVRPAGAGAPARVPSGVHWSGQSVLTGYAPSAAKFGTGGLVTARLPLKSDPFVQNPQVTETISLQEGTAAGGDAPPQPTPIPAIVTRDLAARAHVAVGGQITLTENGVEQPLKIAGIVPALPSATSSAPGVLVDWNALHDNSMITGVIPGPPTEWWLATRSGDTAPAVRALAAHSAWSKDLADRVELRHRLRDAPLGGALQGALVIGFAAALVFAVIGFAVNTAVSARERVTEFAILRALGVSARQVFGLVAVEQAFLVGLGVAGGLLLGVVVTHLVVPHIVLTVRATAPYPPARVIVEWPVVLAMLAAVIVLLAATLLLLVRSLRRHGLGQAVRLGEDR